MRSLAIVIVLAGVALADGPALQVDVAVGDTAKRDVGYARGLMCDDPSIVTAEITTDTARDTNVVAFTGVTAGRTLCRAGTQTKQLSYVFTVDVVAAKKKSPRR